MRYIICLIIFFAASTAISQKIEDYSLKHSMKQDGLSMQFTVLDPDKKGISHYDIHKTYYWFKAQKVMGTQGGSAGQLLHGAFESFYANKQLCAKGNYLRGLKNGMWFYWREDGTLIKTENWKNGTQSGEQIDYNSNGVVTKRTVIRGKRSVTECGDTLIEIHKTFRKITLMDSNGRVLSVDRYKKNLLHGKQEIYSDSSKTVTTYKNGQLIVPKAKKEKTRKAEKPSGEKKENVFSRLRSKLFPKKDEKASSDNQEETKKPRKTKKEKTQQTEQTSEPKEKRYLFKRKKA